MIIWCIYMQKAIVPREELPKNNIHGFFIGVWFFPVFFRRRSSNGRRQSKAGVDRPVEWGKSQWWYLPNVLGITHCGQEMCMFFGSPFGWVPHLARRIHTMAWNEDMQMLMEDQQITNEGTCFDSFYLAGVQQQQNHKYVMKLGSGFLNVGHHKETCFSS